MYTNSEDDEASSKTTRAYRSLRSPAPVRFAIATGVITAVGAGVSLANGTTAAIVTVTCFALLAVAIVYSLIAVRHLQQNATRLRVRYESTQRLLDHSARHRAMTERIDRAFLVCDTPTEALRTAGALSRVITDGYSVRLLLATTRAQSLVWQIRLDNDRPSTVEPLPQTAACCALRTLRPSVTFDSAEPGSCHHLDVADATSAVCLPVPGSREYIGVLEIEGPVGQPPDDDQVELLTEVATRLGQRLAALRATLVDDIGDATDPMTGLPIRDEVFRKIPEILRLSPTTALALADIDGWSGFAERHGPKAASSALRLVGTTLAVTLRPGDALTRVGDGRFLMVLPRCGSVDAHRAMERVREKLVLAAAEAGSPPITLSIGLADTETESGFESLLDAAEIGMEQAQLDGGNRALIGTCH